ncbi:hypothetical protein ACFQZZ_14380 [Nocardia sp. GCM10030253]|uniref:hypothetical protein n=1 Tax=Nocardia sp. GCM10030253 TaxID=3273404 RepID=UPI00363B4B02
MVRTGAEEADLPSPVSQAPGTSKDRRIAAASSAQTARMPGKTAGPSVRACPASTTRRPAEDCHPTRPELAIGIYGRQRGTYSPNFVRLDCAETAAGHAPGAADNLMRQLQGRIDVVERVRINAT